MFECRMVEGGVLKKIVEAMLGLVDTGTLSSNEDGVTMQAMDSSHVSLVNLQLDSDGFDLFRCDRPHDLGLKMENLNKVLKCAEPSDTITIKHQEGEDKCVLMFESEAQDRISDFGLKLMDIEGEQLGIPETDYSAIVTMPSKEFQKICRNLQTMGDTCKIEVSKEGITFKVPESGDVVGSGSVTLRKSESVDKEKKGGEVIIEMDEAVELQFALRYLNHFTKATNLSETVTLSLTSEAPLVVEYPIEKYGFIRYYLAPKIDEDEDE